MQASKIVPHDIYALRLDGKLVRFRVTAVITRRERATGSPHDYTSLVEGYVILQDGGGQDQTRVLDPKALLGSYEEQVELVERKRREDEAVDAKKRERDERAQRLIARLYAMTGLPLHENEYKRAFRPGYQGDLDVSVEGVAALLEVMEALDPDSAAA
jgi:hypothetical protein